MCQSLFHDAAEKQKQKRLQYKKKTADVSRGRHMSPRKTTSEQRAQKFHTDDAQLPALREGISFQPIRSTT